MRPFWLVALVVLGLLSEARVCLAQASEPGPAASPPVLETFVPALLPEAAAQAGASGVVDIILTVDETGHVEDAQLEHGLGQALDEAALAAVRQFVFAPATRDGQPARARIRYRYVFEAAPEAALPPATQPVSSAEPAATVPPVAATSPVAEADLYTGVGRVEEEAHESVRRSVPREDLVRTAGTRGDPLRTIELLPGVARPPSGQGMVLIRGSAPGDSQVFLSGAPIYNLYHFGGLTSVANGFLLSGIDLYPGNFSVRYGRKTGGVIATGFRDPKSDGLHGVLDVNMIDTSLLVEAPITKKLSIAVAGRRSYMDLWFKKLAQSADLSVGAAPVYYDYQVVTSYRPSTRDHLRLVGYGSFDELSLGLRGANEHDPKEHGTFKNQNSFHRGQLEWHRAWSDKLSSDLTVGAGPILVRTQLGSQISVLLQGFDVVLRDEWHLQLMSALKANFGVDAQLAQLHVRYDGPAAQQAEGDPSAMGPLSARANSQTDVDKTYARPAIYAEGVAQVSKRLELTAGARVDYFGDVKKFGVDPRLNARLVLGNTALRAGVGLFSQPPDYNETLAGYGNPHLSPVRALHYGAGVEQSFGRYGMLSLDGFYKQLSRLVVNGSAEASLENGGKGRIYGLEVLGRLQPVGRLSGFVAYTLSRSERNDENGAGYRLFDYDQTHILTMSGNLSLGAGFTFGSTFRLVSGNPRTPVVSSLYQANRDVYLPVYGATNSSRDPKFYRLDVRIEKRWLLGRGSLTAYLDVQNATNHQNTEGKAYSFDYARSKNNPGLPILPSLGLRAQL